MSTRLKNTKSLFPLANRQPLRQVEQVCVFYRNQCTYNPQKQTGKPHRIGNPGPSQMYGNAFQQLGSTVTDQYYPTDLLTAEDPTDVLEFSVRRGASFSRVEDFAQYILRTYSNPGDTVLDICCSNGTTGVACKTENRNFIGFDLVLPLL